MVNAKAKIILRSSIMVWDTDFCCSRGYCSFYNTYAKVQIQGLIIKEFKSKVSKLSKLKPVDRKSSVLFCTNKLAKLIHQEKKEISKKSHTRKILFWQ